MATLTKSQTWAAVQKIIETYELGDEIQLELAKLLEPKGKASTRITKTIDGETYKNCRFTNTLWKSDDLVYQNDEQKKLDKDKGYSEIGISLWNKGQKHIKQLKSDLTDLILEEKPDAKKVEALKTELKSIMDGNLGNSYEWLKQFATKEQAKKIKDNSYSIDTESDA